MRASYYRLLLLFLGICVISNQPYAQIDSTLISKYSSMTLEELIKVPVNSGSLINNQLLDIPASITVIDEKDIALTPARNILDLIEVYVPGALFFNHYEGPHPAIRGISSDRNNKILLLVNGININQKSHNGASTELENWDMNDIHKIEIIRGPGSVTYGPGAIMGVINIITKDHEQVNGTHIQLNHTNRYNSTGASASYGYTSKDINFYGYTSLTSTKGFEPDAFAIWDHESGYYKAGYVGKEITPLPPVTYFKDYNGIPQIKSHLNLDFGRFKLWTRYTNSGSSVQNTISQTKAIQTYRLDSVESTGGETHYYRSAEYGKPTDLAQVSHKNFMIAGEHHSREYAFGKIKTQLSWYTHDFDRPRVTFYEYDYDFFSTSDKIVKTKTDPLIFMQNYAENELKASMTLNKDFSDHNRIAFGFSYARQAVGKGWNDKSYEMIAGDASNILSDSSSVFLYAPAGGRDNYRNTQDKLYLMGDGYAIDVFSGLTEASFQIFNNLNLHIGARIDKYPNTELLFSPRLATVFHPSSKQTFKLNIQQSNRMTSLTQIYQQDMHNSSPNVEKLQSAEASYIFMTSKNLKVSFTGFYSQIDILSWSNQSVQTINTGFLKLAGGEAEFEYKRNSLSTGFNHSIAEQLDWDLSEMVSSAGISPSEYETTDVYKDDTLTFNGSGDNIANWANQSSKLWFTYRFFNNRLIWHTNTQVFWQYEWGKDVLSNNKKAARNSNYSDEILSLIEKAESKNVFGTNIQINTSLNLRLNERVTMSVHAINITGDFKRYSMWSFYKPLAVPEYVRETAAFMLKFSMKL